MTETRFAALLISRRASWSSGAINSRSVSSTRSRPSMMSLRWLSSRARPRARFGIRRVRRKHIADHELAFLAVVACDRARRAVARRFDGSEPRKAGKFTNDDREQSEAGNAGEDRREISKRLRIGKQVRDELARPRGQGRARQARRPPTRTTCPSASTTISGARARPGSRPERRIHPDRATSSPTSIVGTCRSPASRPDPVT